MYGTKSTFHDFVSFMISVSLFRILNMSYILIISTAFKANGIVSNLWAVESDS